MPDDTPETPTPEATALKPCPFCGGPAFVQDFPADPPRHGPMRGVGCGPCGFAWASEDRDGILAWWGRRAPSLDPAAVMRAAGRIGSLIRALCSSPALRVVCPEPTRTDAGRWESQLVPAKDWILVEILCEELGLASAPGDRAPGEGGQSP